MSVIASKGYYRFVQVLSVLVVPLIAVLMIFVKIDDRVIVNGVVESSHHVILRSPLEKTLIEDIKIKPGSDVRAGQELLTFRDLNNWRLELEKIRRRVIMLTEKAEIYESLNKKGAQSTLSAKELKTEAETLRIEAKSLEQQVEKLTLRAPFSGRITDVLVKEHMNVAVGTELVALSAMDEKVIRCFVPENRYSLLREGQTVAIKSNLYNYLHYTVYRGVVKNFSQYGTRGQDTSDAAASAAMPVFETFIKVLDDDHGAEMLKVGSTAACEIVVERRPLYELFLKK